MGTNYYMYSIDNLDYFDSGMDSLKYVSGLIQRLVESTDDSRFWISMEKLEEHKEVLCQSMVYRSAQLMSILNGQDLSLISFDVKSEIKRLKDNVRAGIDSSINLKRLTSISPKPSDFPYLWHWFKQYIAIELENGKENINFPLLYTKICRSYHIGKKSAGWAFSIHVDENEGINNLDDLIREIKDRDAIIVSEYDIIIPLDELISYITEDPFGVGRPSESSPNFDPKFNLYRHNDSRVTGHGDGPWDYITGEFS